MGCITPIVKTCRLSHSGRWCACCSTVEEHTETVDLKGHEAAFADDPETGRTEVRTRWYEVTTGADTGKVPGQILADAGYRSASNLDRAADYSAVRGTELFIATGRPRRGDPPPVAPRGRTPDSATSKRRMARRLTTQTGRRVYARRKAIVDPVFGQMSTVQSAKHLLLRGFDQARDEWLLLAVCHNLRKLHGHLGVRGLADLASG